MHDGQETSVTRFGKISPLWHNFCKLWPFWKSSFNSWEHFEFTLAKFIFFWANLQCLKWPNNMQIIQQSGHTACEHCGARPRWCRPFFLKVFSFYLRTRNLGMFIKWANHGLFLFIFVLFTFLSKWQIYNLNRMNWKKRRWCAGDSNWGDRIEGADESTELWLPPPLCRNVKIPKVAYLHIICFCKYIQA